MRAWPPIVGETFAFHAAEVLERDQVSKYSGTLPQWPPIGGETFIEEYVGLCYNSYKEVTLEGFYCIAEDTRHRQKVSSFFTKNLIKGKVVFKNLIDKYSTFAYASCLLL